VKRIKLLALFLVPLLVGSCHYKYTAPFFWNHQSSAAANMAIGGWVLTVIGAAFIALFVATEWSRKP
jgi:hypothetical protein